MNVGVIDVICSFHRDYEQEFFEVPISAEVGLSEAHVVYAVLDMLDAEQRSCLAVMSLAQHGGDFPVLWLKGREDPVRFHFGAEIAGAKVGKP
jgi:hypothetical protein